MHVPANQKLRRLGTRSKYIDSRRADKSGERDSSSQPTPRREVGGAVSGREGEGGGEYKRIGEKRGGGVGEKRLIGESW